MRRCSALSDAELMTLLRHGDTAAFTEIYDRYWNKLTAVAYNLTRDQSAAKEIVQDLFIGVWNRREKLEVNNLAAYLGTAVKFSVFKQIERDRRHKAIELSQCSIADYSRDDEQIEARFIEDYIHGLVESLPEKCRLVFNYSRVEGMSVREIARKMDIAEKTVEGHLTRSLKVLRLNLKDAGLLTAAVSLHIFFK